MAIADIIKYEGDNSTFIWKHPKEDFNTMSQLIVHESQEAIFFLNGQALDLFGPGRHTLETQNIPLIGKALNVVTGGKTPFHCEVYFINKTIQMGFKWGTPERVRFIEPTYGVPVEIGASGELNLAVADSRKLLVKLVGTMKGIAWNDKSGFTQSIQSSFRPLISTEVKAHLASAIKSEGIDLLEIDERLPELSEGLRKKLIPGFEEYGLTIPQFYVTTISLPDSKAFDRIRELHTINLQTKYVEAETLIRTAKAESEAAVTAAQRKITLEEQATETEIAKRQAERELIAAQAKAEAAKAEGFANVEVARAQGLTQAEVMRAQGYNQKDVLQADVQKAYAEGLGTMVANGGGGVTGDIVGLGVGLAAAGQISNQMGDMVKGFNADKPLDTVQCSGCGTNVPATAKFCPECGEKIVNLRENEIICPSCGAKTSKGKFCQECGAPLIRKCAKCSAEIPNGAKFCSECGERV